MTFTRIFVLERKFAYVWGAQALFLGGTGPEMHSSSTRPVSLFWGTILARGGAQFSLGGVKSSGLGGTAPKCPPPRGTKPALHIVTNPVVMQLPRRVLQKISRCENVW